MAAIMCGTFQVASDILTKKEAETLDLLYNETIIRRGDEYRSANINSLNSLACNGYQEVLDF